MKTNKCFKNNVYSYLSLFSIYDLQSVKRPYQYNWMNPKTNKTYIS